MELKETIKPTSSPRVMDLLTEAGMDVTDWQSTRGQPASNPKYVYEWAFIQREVKVVLSLWYADILQEDGRLYYDLNPRARLEDVRRSSALRPAHQSSVSRRASNMDTAIAHAYDKSLPVRVIVGDGVRRDPFTPQSQKASRMKLRRLDEQTWTVQRYDGESGECRLCRGASPIFADQFSAARDEPVNKLKISGEVWERDPQVREAVLNRAQGTCELCRKAGFTTSNGRIYLETHHVISLSEGGPDNEQNVVAICPNDHREAHFGERRNEILMQLMNKLRDSMVPACEVPRSCLSN